MTNIASRARPAVAGIEARSIEHVPDSERHGLLRRQGPFWFVINFQPVSLALGFIGPAMGLSLAWTVIASFAGGAVGTLFVAFHATQGPVLGLPQMVQSRAQFGYRGVLVPLMGSVFTFLGYNVVNIVVVKDGLHALYGLGETRVALVVAVVGTIVAIWGHDLLHRLFGVLFWLSLPLWLALSIGVMTGAVPTHEHPAGGFTALAFAAQFAVTASYAISGAPYVSDYTRYLPRDTRPAAIIGAVFLGNTASPMWLIPLGAWMSIRLGVSDALTGVSAAGNAVLPFLGDGLVLASALVLTALVATNTYSGMLAVLTAVDSVRPVVPTRRLRVLATLGFAAVSTAFGVGISGSTTTVNTVLLIMLYLLVPWTAINLSDYFLVRHARYDVVALLSPAGEYGAWSPRGLIAYLAGVLAELPFAVLPGFTGAAAAALDRIDIAFVVGLGVAAAVYVLWPQRK